MDNSDKRRNIYHNGRTAIVATAAALLATATAAYADDPVTMAPPVAGSSAPASIGAYNASADTVFNWTEVPANQRVPLVRATFDQGGYQLYDTAGETIVVPFTNDNLYVMKFAPSPDGSTYFVNEGDYPVLYVPRGGYLENATVPGGRWYPFTDEFRPSEPVFLGIAPSWTDYCDMGWYPGMTYWGGYWGYTSFTGGGVFVACPGLFIVIGGNHYYGWHRYHDYWYHHHPPYRITYYNRRVYHWAAHPDWNRRLFSGTRQPYWIRRTVDSAGRAHWTHQPAAGARVTQPVRRYPATGGTHTYQHNPGTGGTHTFHNGNPGPARRTFRGAPSNPQIPVFRGTPSSPEQHGFGGSEPGQHGNHGGSEPGSHGNPPTSGERRTFRGTQPSGQIPVYRGSQPNNRIPVFRGTPSGGTPSGGRRTFQGTQENRPSAPSGQVFGGGRPTQPAPVFGGGRPTQPAPVFGGGRPTQPAPVFGGGRPTQSAPVSGGNRPVRSAPVFGGGGRPNPPAVHTPHPAPSGGSQPDNDARRTWNGRQ